MNSTKTSFKKAKTVNPSTFKILKNLIKIFNLSEFTLNMVLEPVRFERLEVVFGVVELRFFDLVEILNGGHFYQRFLLLNEVSLHALVLLLPSVRKLQFGL